MERKKLDHEWSFVKSGLSPYLRMMSEGAEVVNLPHDFTISTETSENAGSGGAVGFYDGGIGSYTKYLDFSEDLRDKRIILEIDGAYRNAEVVLNGHLVAKQLNGYFPFHADLTPYIIFGEQNRITIAVNNLAPFDSRWYTGSGIYRNVELLTAPQIHLSPWSTFFYTQRIDNDGTAYCMAEITVENRTAKESVEYVNVELCYKGTKDTIAAVAAKGRNPVAVPPLSKATVRIPLVVESAKLWDTENPNLYCLKAALDSGDKIETKASNHNVGGSAEPSDRDETTVGIRTVSADVKHGLRLNGNTIKLKGGCVHHDNGLLGAASFYDAEYRKYKLLKDNGFNAIRCAHNPPSKVVLDVCDELGLLVIDEAFDCWQMRSGGQASDYHLIFAENWKKDIELMITRSRSRACIIMWSIGNEIYERNGLAGGYSLANELAAFARSIDPTRLITCSIPSPFNGLDDKDMGVMMQEWARMFQEGKQSNSTQNMNSPWAEQMWGEKTEPFAAALDVVGYNYLDDRYERDGQEFPNRVICGQESYPRRFDILWDLVERLHYVIGDFVWTAFDYIGEAGIGRADYLTKEEAAAIHPLQGTSVHYPWRLAYCGDFDICGFPRPQLFYRKIVWGSDETFIAVKNPANEGLVEIISRWGWPECYNAWSFDGFDDKPVIVNVYSRAEEVELFLNGKSVGVKPAGKENRFTAEFKLAYQKGTLTAISRSGGEEVSQASLTTTSSVKAIRLTTEGAEIKADGDSLSYIIAELVDENGQVVPFEDKRLRASVTGSATLAGFGTGRPITTENYSKGEFTSWLGKCVAILRSTTSEGSAVLRIEADGLTPAEISICVRT
jgi:beta-galactosidase